MYIRQAYPNELYHHGILGMKWGIRRFQNPDGSLTPAGKKRYYKSDGTLTKKGVKEYSEQHAKKQREEAVKQANSELLTKMGFKSFPDSSTMEKRIKTKRGLTRIISVDSKDEHNPETLKRTVKTIERNIDKIERDGDKVVIDEVTSRFGDAVKPGMLRGPYIQLMRDGGSILNYDMEFDNGYRCFPYAEYNPATHKFYRVAIDD